VPTFAVSIGLEDERDCSPESFATRAGTKRFRHRGQGARLNGASIAARRSTTSTPP
jgi:hypothetical protein